MNTSTAILTLLRTAYLVALLSLFGTLVFRAAAAAPALGSRLVRCTRISLWSAVGLGLAWTAVAAWMNSAMPALEMQFRRGLAGPLVLLLVAAPLLSRHGAGRLAAIFLVGIAIGLQTILGHAAESGTTAASAEIVHLLAAGAWLGSLPALFIVVSRPPPAEADLVRQRFMPLKLAALAAIAVSAAVLAQQLVGSFPALIGTPYGRLALLKLGLFILALAVAAFHPISSRRAIGVEIVIGVLIVLAAAFLAAMPPAVQQQPLWPFPWRPSLDALGDPEDQRQIASALIAAGAGVGIATLGTLWRRTRIVAAGLGAVLVLLAMSMLGPLVTEAYPTSFYRSPTDFSAASINHGRDVFAANCATCHGAEGRGDGPAAAQLPLRPADLTAPHLWGHSDGELFWWVSTGRPAPDGTLVMPGFAPTLSEDDRWNVIDFMRANNAGLSLRYAGAWPAPIRAPALAVDCAGMAARDMKALRGNVVRIIAADDDENGRHPPGIPPQDGYNVITLHLTRAMTRPPPGECVMVSPAAWVTYAVLAGSSPNELTDSEFLVDPDGWLRAAWRPGTGTGWSNVDRLIAEVRRICTHPIAVETGGDHEHHD